jgi:Double-GTPase 1
MTRTAAVPLESWSMVQQCAQPAICSVCDGENLRDTERCRHCSAPLALSTDSNRKGETRLMVAVVGAGGVGKSVYLGMLLDMLSRSPERLSVLARGAYSVSLQQSTTAALARCEFPPRTPLDPDNWNWVRCEVRFPQKTHPADVIIPDIAGDTLVQEIDHAHSVLVVRSFLSKAHAGLLLLDAPRLQQAVLDEEFYGMKLLTYLGELTADAKRGWPARPIAVVFTKADQCEDCFTDPAAFARRHAPGLWRLCRERFTRHQFFAASVAGACAYRRCGIHGQRELVPLRIEPRGIVEPFEWAMRQFEGPT